MVFGDYKTNLLMCLVMSTEILGDMDSRWMRLLGSCLVTNFGDYKVFG